MKALGLQSVPVAEIDASERLRQVDEAQAQLLAENITDTGRLRQPIEVRQIKGGGYRLIAGAHRLRAIQILQWAKIDAFVFECSDDEALLAEIDENLVRNELCPLDKAVFLYERKAVYERLYPQVRNGSNGGRGRNVNEKDILSFSKDTAERCGLNRKTIDRLVAIARIAPAVRVQIAGTWLAKHQAELLALAKLPPSEQAEVVALVLAEDGPVKSVRAAKALGRSDAPKSASDEQFAALVDRWGRASASARGRFLDWLDGQGELDAYTSREEAA